MPYTSVLVVSDNETIVQRFIELLDDQPELIKGRTFRFACYPKHDSLRGKKISGYTIEPLDIKQDYQELIDRHDLVISAHCKQIFPEALVSSIKCVNIHPGYNPYNRGWYPQVFSILNGKPLGATIHEIDAKLDHGKIIDRELVELKTSDTSLTAYTRVQAKELELLKRNLARILTGDYQTLEPEEEGNINFKKDFEALRELDLAEEITFQHAIDRLRALSHPPFKNAYFIDTATGKRIWLRVELEEE
ncbi:MAG TPA: dTDP-4-amino-4,6-dideoxyglucose formyltransferase [Candidatus Saccharimonadales bacterium]|nr:dTDP-4-amino-4,6-dideoxyglucose formyltransferase [Candidatus Saccharimonadales bacterium]